MQARSSARLAAGSWRALMCAARSSSVPVRSSLSVKTLRVPARNASRLTQGNAAPEHTTTAGSALPMK